MTTWLTKDLTLDLLAISIGALNSLYTTIRDHTGGGGEHPTTQPGEPQPGEPHPGEPHPGEPQTTRTATPEELAPAQNILRTIATTEGPDWITNTLFPKYGITTLSTINPTQLPNLITDAEQHTQQL